MVKPKITDDVIYALNYLSNVFDKDSVYHGYSFRDAIESIKDDKTIDHPWPSMDNNSTPADPPSFHPKAIKQLNDPVNHPAHYTQGGIECIDAIEAACTGLDGEEGYLVGQVIKYIWRWKHKNGLQDLEKAKWYLERLIANVGKTT